MKQTTHREYLTWLEHWFNEMNRPSRSDNYLMQIAQILSSLPALVWGASPPAYLLDKFRIKFEKERPKKEVYVRKSKYDPPGPLTKEQLERFKQKQAQGMWGRAIGAAKRLVGR